MKDVYDLLKELKNLNARIYIVDNKIKLDIKTGLLTNEIAEGIKYYRDDIIAIVGQSSKKSDFIQIEKNEYQASYPISDAQRRLWIISQFENSSLAYNIPGNIHLNQNINIENFKQAIAATIDRHEILRTVFKVDEKGEVRQWILNTQDLGFQIDYKDFRKEKNKQELVQSYISEDSYKAFDLVKGPLLRACLIRVEEDSYIFYYNMHHIISDGWSMEVLFRDISLFYEAYNENRQLDSVIGLKPLRIQYKDYSAWQLAQLEEDLFKSHKAYWLTCLKGELPLLDLPNAKQRPKVKTNNGYTLSSYIGSVTSTKLKRYSEANGGSLFMGLLSAWNILMYRFTGQKDIIIGTPVAGREHADLADQIGFYVNTLALRNEIDPQENFNRFYNRLKDNTLKAFSHQMYPFDRLVEELNLQRDTSRSVIFDILLDFHNTGETIKNIKLHENEINTISDLGNALVKYDLELHFTEARDYISIQVNFNKDIYEKHFIERLIIHYKNLIPQLIDNATELVGRIEFLTEEEKTQLTRGFNNTEVAYPENKTILDLFAQQVTNTPDNVAIRNNEKVITYKELDELSNQLAHCLVKHYEVKSNELIGIKLDKEQWAIISMLGVLKAGATYVPIDPEYPAFRKQYILSESKIKLLITDTNYLFDQEEFEGIVFSIDVEFEKDNHSTDHINHIQTCTSLAYVIYTSGSTGNPKGVMINHSSLLNYLMWAQSTYSNDDAKNLNFGLFSSLSFDLTVTSLYLPLISGGTLTIFNPTWDISSLLKAYFQSDITCIKLTPAHISLLKSLEIHHTSIQVAIVGGEALTNPQVEILRALNPEMKIYNEYGPTESTVGCIVKEIGSSKEPILIGKPISNTRIYLLNEEKQLQPIGVPGEIYIGGSGLAQGYLNQESLTWEKFITDPFKKGERVYKTGDLGKWLPDGNIEYKGRTDNQVKIRGYRIELGEIEHALLMNEKIEEAVVLVKENQENEKELVAYITGKNELNASDLRSYLKEFIPEYMLPEYVVQLNALPLNSNGKIDKKSLPNPEGLGLTNGVEYVAPRTEVEKKLVEIWSQVLKKDSEKIGIDEGFFTLGGNSIKLVALNSKIENEFSTHCSVASLFQYSTVRLQAGMLLQENSVGIEQETELDTLTSVFHSKSLEVMDMDIAVIGMSIKSPGSKNISEFWKNIKRGKESVTQFSYEELRSYGIPQEELDKENYIKANSYLEDKEYFDANFFGYLPDEAKLMDPQIRVFHEVVWSAMEDAGYDPISYKGMIGLYAGAASNMNWQAYNYITNEGKIDPFTAGNLGSKDFANALIAHKLNLKGPVNSIETACSTSLVAIHQAVRSILAGENHIAIAGGVSISNKQYGKGYFHQEGLIFSKDGYNRTFDADASGTIEGEGAGAVVLKKLSEAIKDGDQLYAVIKGSAINNDGNRKIGFAAPSVDGQSEVIRLAHKVANVSPESISYVEAHGTATKLGDPIEILALTKAFGKSDSKYCALGSIKTNVGHLNTAAGVAGFIKTVLCLKHKQLVPSLHFKSPNPEIKFEETAFYVNTELKEWERKQFPRRAGVSSFGIGGTNAHVVLEEPPTEINILEKTFPQIITLSANTSAALIRQQENLKEFLAENKEGYLPNIAWTLQNRRSFPYRLSFVSQTIDQTIDYLEKIKGNPESQNVPVKGKKIVFMFSGQGSQYVNMGLDLYEMKESVFRKTIDVCFEIAERWSKVDFRKILYPNDPDEENLINETINTQPILFMFEYALAKQIAYYGIRPNMMIGHSLGEYVAACFGGVLTLENAIQLVIKRAALMQGLPKGMMVAVGISANKLEGYLSEGINIAAINAPESCVLSGATEAITKSFQRLNEEGVTSKILFASHAFHSAMMDPILEKFTHEIDTIEIHASEIPYISNVTGKKITNKELRQKTYWADHIRKPVKFSAGINQLIDQDNVVFIEVGPGNSLCNFARQHGKENKNIEVHQLIGKGKIKEDDYIFLLNKIADLWKTGLEINWERLHNSKKQRQSLPTYPFEKVKYPIGKDAIKMIIEQVGQRDEAKRLDEAKWYHEPSWKKSSLNSQSTIIQQTDWCLFFCDEGDIALNLIHLCEIDEDKIIKVKIGSAYKKISDLAFELNPYDYDGYEKLFNELNTRKILLAHIVHLFSLDQRMQGPSEPIEMNKRFGFYSVLHIAKELNTFKHHAQITITVITNKLENVFGNEVTHPSKSLLSGLVPVISQENPLIQIRIIDFSLGNNDENKLTLLAEEIKSEIDERFIAYRSNVRWVRHYNALSITSSGADNKSKLKNNGTYLLTNGLNGLGFLLTNYLIKKYNANLILIGQDDEKEPQLQILLKTGYVAYYNAETSNLIAMRKVIEHAEERFGNVDGVIYTTNVEAGNLMNDITLLSVEENEKNITSILLENQVIEELFKNKILDFCLFVSSLNSITGGRKLAYSEVLNAYLDSLSKTSLIKNTISVNFDQMNFNDELKSESTMNPPEIIKVVETILQKGIPTQLIISLYNLEHRIQKLMYPAEDKDDQSQNNSIYNIPLERANLSEIYSAPQSETERELCEMFESFFGIRKVGVDDDFFELGGDSLKGMTLISRIHQKFNVVLLINDVLEYATIRKLAKEINALKSIAEMQKDGAGKHFEHEIEI